MKLLVSVSVFCCYLYTTSQAQVLEVIYPDTNYVKLMTGLEIRLQDFHIIDADTPGFIFWNGIIRNFQIQDDEVKPVLTLKEAYEKVIVYWDSSKRDTLIIAHPSDLSFTNRPWLYSSGSTENIYGDSLPEYSLTHFDYYKEFYPNGIKRLEEWIEFKQYKKKKWGAYTIRHSIAWYENGQRRWKMKKYNNIFCLTDSAWHSNGDASFQYIFSKSDTIIRIETYPNRHLKRKALYYCQNRGIDDLDCIHCGSWQNKPHLLSYTYYDTNEQIIEKWPTQKVETYLGENDLTSCIVFDTALYNQETFQGYFEGEIGDTVCRIQDHLDYNIGDTVVVYFDSSFTDTAIIAIYSQFPTTPTGYFPIKKEERKYDRNGNMIAYFNLEKGIDCGWHSSGQPKWNLTPFVYTLYNFYRNNTLHDKVWYSSGQIKREYSRFGGDTVVEMNYYANGQLDSKHIYTKKKNVPDDLYYHNFKKLIFEGLKIQYLSSEYYYDNGQLQWKGYNDKKGDPLRKNRVWYYRNGKPANTWEYYGKYPYGKYEQYYENGQLQVLGQFSMNLPEPITRKERKNPRLYDPKMIKSESYKVGTWQYWDEEGNLLKEEIYKDGLVDEVIRYDE